MLFSTWILVATFLSAAGEPQAEAEALVSGFCASQTTCSACISVPKCAWCSQKDFAPGKPRCDIEDSLVAQGCGGSDIVNPRNEIHPVKDDPLSDVGLDGSTVQLKPQEVKLVLRPNEPVKFKVTFRQAEDYPVDLYYLMDSTISMSQHKKKLAELGHSIAESMKDITKKFRLGFGSFIDKVAMPFTDMKPERLKNPCAGYQMTCDSPYGFRNHLPLTDNVTQFTEEVAKAPLSANLDNAEGGFDAAMQVIVCQNEIQWNEFSRKIVLFATDSIFHYAGDGKLAGIVKPNDGQCHLDEEGYYTMSTHQDYPSLSQINTKLIEHKVNIIFAVPEKQLSTYQHLMPLVEGSHAGVLAEDSSNIVELIRGQYHAIRSKVELRDNAPDFLKITYSSTCADTRPSQITHVCEDLPKGQEVEFEVQVELMECPEQGNQTVVISPVGIREYLRLELDLQCTCNCEASEQKQSHSPHCNDMGTYTCGICECDANWYGPKCECEGDDVARADKLSLCTPYIEETNISIVCSGKGDCICGVCTCYKPERGHTIYGKFCECDTFSCNRDEEERVCGGNERGECCDGQCRCKPGWKGDACDCSTDITSCIAPSDVENGTICSGRGQCKCGVCQCEKDDKDWYAGPYCEDCSTCEGLCSRLFSCVQCSVYGTGPLSEENCDQKCPSLAESFTAVENLEENLSSESGQVWKCTFKDESDGCAIHYAYSYDKKGRTLVRVRKEKECPIQAELWIIIGGIAGGVFLIGLIILLVCRLLVYIKDRRDYLRFEEHTRNPKFALERSPIYKDAISEFKNPTYSPGAT